MSARDRFSARAGSLLARRWVVIVLRGLAVLVLLRVLLALTQAALVDYAASKLGLDSEYDDLDLSLLSGEAELRGLRLRDAEPGADARSWLELDFAAVDVALWDSLWSEPTVERIDVDGLRVRVERKPDGTVAWLERLARFGGAEETEASPRDPLDWRSPVVVRSASARGIAIEIDDASVWPPFAATLAIDARATDLGEQGRVELWATSPGLLESLRVDATVSSGLREIAADVEGRFEGLSLRPLAAELSRAGLRVSGDSLSGRGSARIGLAPGSGGAEECEGGASLEGLELGIDGEPALALESFAIAVRSLSRERVEIASARAVAPAANATRAPDGAFGVAGLEWIGVAKVEAPDAATTATPSQPGTPASGWSLVVDELAVEEGRLRLDDRSLSGSQPLEVDLARLATRDLAWPPAEERESPLELRFAAPGVLDAAEVLGELRSARPSLALRAELRATGVTLERLAPHLARLGLAPELESGELVGRARLHVDLAGPAPRVSAALENVRFDDRRLLASLARASVEGFEPGAENGALVAGSVAVEGPELDVLRGADGALHVLGLRTIRAPEAGPDAAGPRAAPDEVPAAPGGAFELPRLRLKELGITNVRVAWRDEAVEPPVERTLTARAKVSELDSTGDSIAPATIELGLSSPGLVEEVSVLGPLQARRAPLALAWNATASGSGLALEPLAPYLSALGLEPTLRSGSAQAELSLSLERAGAGSWRAGASVGNARLSEDGRDLAALGALRVRGLTLGGERPTLSSLEVFQPRLALARDADGRLHALGLRTTASDAGEEASEDASEPDAPAELGISVPPFELGELRVEGASLAWSDAGVVPGVETELTLEARLERLADDLEPGSFEARAALAGVCEVLAARGTLAVGPDRVALTAEASAEGLRAGPLAAYLPGNVACDLERGALRVPLELRVASHPEGGLSASLSASGASLTDDGRELGSLARASLAVTRIDPRARIYDIGEVVAELAGIPVERGRDGAWRAFGLRVSPGEDPVGPAAGAGERGPPPSFPGEPPHVRLGALELGLTRLELRDAALGDDAEPLILSASLSTPEPCTLLSADAEELPPLRLEARAALDPLCEGAELDLELAPFAPDPEARLALRVHGLRGDALARVAPALAGTVDASGLESGELDVRASARLELARRGPLGIDYAQGLRGELVVDRAELRARPGGEVEAGIESARAELSRYDASTGDVRFKSIEIVKPRLRARRDQAGLHAFGLTLRLPAAAQGTTGEPAPGSVEVVSASSGASGDGAPRGLAEAPELAIDRFSIAGLDVVLTDESAAEPVLVPLTDLELEVRRFSTRALAAGEPVQFHAMLQSGAVELPPRVVSDSLLEGIAGAAASALAGRGDEPAAREERPLFGTVTVDGRVAPFPSPSGYVALDVSELELVNFRPLAAARGVELGDGLLDLSARARLAGDKGLSLDSTASFAYLSLSEPPGGPITHFLSLPAPLDTVLFLLEDAEGRQKVPLSVRVGPDGLGGGRIAAAAAQAAAVVIARAVASSPLRIAGTLTDALGLTGGEAPKPGADAREFEFEAGDVAVAFSPAVLEALRRKLADDRRLVVTLQHEFGRADLERAARLANPDAGDCRLLSSRLRQRKAELARSREELAAQTRAEYALGRAEEAERTRERVRALDRELGAVEGSLDRLHELLRPGAERRQGQRARAAALAIAAERLERVRQALLERGVARDRIEVRSIRAVPGAREAGGRVLALPRKR